MPMLSSVSFRLCSSCDLEPTTPSLSTTGLPAPGNPGWSGYCTVRIGRLRGKFGASILRYWFIVRKGDDGFISR